MSIRAAINGYLRIRRNMLRARFENGARHSIQPGGRDIKVTARYDKAWGLPKRMPDTAVAIREGA